MADVHVRLVSGSLRGASTNSALVRTAAALEVDGVGTEGAVVRLPVAHGAAGEDGTVADPEARAGTVAVLEAPAAHVRARRADPEWIGRPTAAA